MLWMPPLIGAVVATSMAPVVISSLRKWRVVDVATGRSSHTGVAIRGVGIATLTGVTAGVISGLLLVDGTERHLLAVVGAGALLGALLGLVEDLRGLPVRVRAGFQVLLGFAVSFDLAFLMNVPFWWIIPAAMFMAGYINAANFMDGINGISGIHGLVSGLFYLVLGYILDEAWLLLAGGVLAASFLAFLPWNLLRRGTFLGDSGSYLLGSFIATISIATWMQGIHPLIAVAPTIIYCVDTGLTLLGRIAKGENWSEPHRSHVYQRLSSDGLGHIRSSLIVGAFTLAVAGLSLLLLMDKSLLDYGIVFLMVALCAAYWMLPRWIGKSRLSQIRNGE